MIKAFRSKREKKDGGGNARPAAAANAAAAAAPPSSSSRPKEGRGCLLPSSRGGEAHQQQQQQQQQQPPHRTSTTTHTSYSGSGSGSTPPIASSEGRRSGRGGGPKREKDLRLSWGEASSGSTASPRRKRIVTGADANACPSLSNEFMVLRDNLSQDDVALVESLGREEEDHRHQEIQKALKRHNVTLNQLNLAEVEMYGRDKELATLWDVFQAVATGGSSAAGIASVAGKAGTGKTRLCQELLGRARASGALVLKGKFDLQNRQEPYTGIQAAFADLPSQVLGIDDVAKRARLISRIKQAVGANVRLVASLVPCIEQILQLPQPETAALATSEGDETPPFSNQAQVSDDDADSVSAISGDENAQGDDFNDPHATRSVRLHLLFRNLVRAMCDPDHPLVLFLDDVQWSDAPSLSLIGNLIGDSRLSHFVLVATSRDEQEEEQPTAGFSGLMDDVRGASMPGIRIEAIRLPLLNQEAVYSIVSTALRSSEERTFKLSEIVHQKSNGNPMYVIQFLIGLFEDGFLRYNIGSMQWMWDELNVRSRFVTDNVVELAEARLLRLTASQQRILMVAACLGQTFDPPKLEFVLTDPKVHILLSGDASLHDQLESDEIDWSTNVRVHLEELVDEAIIEYIAQLNTYCFIHDLIQQAAFELIPEPARVRVQCEVGQRLLRCHGPATIDEKYYFRAVELANVGVHESMEDNDGPDRVALAYVNDDAGQKAMAKAAYSAALKYFDAGLLWLGPDAWTKEPKLALDLSSGAVEAAFCSGDFDTMEARMASVLDRDLPIEDKVRVYLIRISSYGVQYRHELCLEIAVKVLKEMGITRLPLRPRSYQVVLEAIKTKFMLRNRTEDSLTSLPLIEKKRWLQAMSITDMLQQIAYNSNQNFFAVMRLRSLRWTLDHGVCSYTPSLFAAYALLLCATGDVQKGHVIGSAALSLSESLHARSSRSKTIITVYGFVVHWASSLRTILKPLLYGHKLGLQTGEVEIAMHNLLNHDFALLATTATPLSNLVLRLRSSGQLMKEYGHEGIRVFSSMTLQFALQLSVVSSESPPSAELSGDVIKESDVRAQFNRTEHALMIGFVDHYCLLLAYYFEDYDRAAKYAQATDAFPKVAVCHFYVPINAFFRGLTSLALAHRATNRRERTGHVKNATKITKQMKAWTESGNPNCIHMLQLLEAELAASRALSHGGGGTSTSRGDTETSRARQLYLVAIASASRNAYLNDKALAHELAFKFHLRCHGPEDRFWAENHYKDALQAYGDWNAHGKARHLADTYGHHFDAAAVGSSADGGGSSAMLLPDSGADKG